MYGGAIEFDGTGTVTNCNLTNNTARYEVLIQMSIQLIFRLL